MRAAPRAVPGRFKQVYGTELSHEQVSRITDQVMDEARAWQTRPLDSTYAVVFLNAIVAKSATTMW
ncbi:transposase [Actinomadura sp. 9N215]|uniref:transposase n=1 Tax=Actinomadura sp. 9N215 TaxID=3375150 RepID=UPI0037ABBD9E